MAKILVVNPPKRHRRRKRAKLAARKRTRRVVRNVVRVRKHRRVRRHKRFSAGRHRPVVKVKRGKIYRPRRSHISPFARFANPFGELAVLGNPHRKRRKHTMARKSHRRRHRRHYSLLSNPLGTVMSKPKEILQKDFLMDAAGIAGGFILPDMALMYVPASFQSSTMKRYLSKTAVVVGLSAAAGLVSKRLSRVVLLGGVASILLDAWTQFRISGANPGTKTYFGDDGVGTYYGGLHEDIGDDF